MYIVSYIVEKLVIYRNGLLINPLEQEISKASLQSTGSFKVLRRLDLDNDSRFSRRRVLYGTCTYYEQEIWKK